MDSAQLNIDKDSQKKEVVVVGGGVIGCTTAWHLAKIGYGVIIIDQNFNKPINYSNNLSGTYASLGILMGHIFKRSSGRNWRLRKRSMQLWPEFTKELSTNKICLKINTPFVHLASSAEEKEFLNSLAIKRKHLGLEVFEQNLSHNASRLWPECKFGGLISHEDGRIDPITLMSSLMNGLTRLKVKKIKAKVSLLKRETITSARWLIQIENKESIKADAVVLCTANGTDSLIKPLGYSRPIEPILGQVLNLNSIKDRKSWDGWPAVLSCNGVNLIPYESNKFFMGATIEPGSHANNIAIEKMKAMEGNCPEWIKSAVKESQWKGIRARPTNQAAPILESLEKGLILNTAHYRNGILLAPACAEWVGTEICKTILSQ